MQTKVELVVSEPRHCEYCQIVVHSYKAKPETRQRTWPYDDVKHEKYLSLLGWPKDFEEEMRRLWVRRRIEPLDVLPGTVYKYPTLTVCQRHLDDANVAEEIESWLSKYCILCDEELNDENLLLPFPIDKAGRLAWAKSLFSKRPCNTLVQKQQQWLFERLTREPATHYRLCLFHFPQSSFSVANDCIDFDQSSQPLSLNICQYENIPRGPQGVVKCPLCDTWDIVTETVQIRTPKNSAERNFLVESLISSDKTALRKGVEKLSARASTICKAHMPEVDPFELIAERKLVASLMVQCVACSMQDLAQNMTPFPHEPTRRIMWVDSMSRRRGNRMRLLNRLSQEGRHYLCPQHFHTNALRYIPGLGLFKKIFFLPVHDPDEKVITKVPDPQEDDYVPLLIDGVDNEKVQWSLDYDTVTSLVGEGDDAEVLVIDEDSIQGTSYDVAEQDQDLQKENEKETQVMERLTYSYDNVDVGFKSGSIEQEICVVDGDMNTLEAEAVDRTESVVSS